MFEKLKEPQYVVVLLVISLTFILDLLAFFCKLSLDRELVIMILTAFNTNGFVTAINYTIGSSAGSKEKDQHIAQLAEKKDGQ